MEEFGWSKTTFTYATSFGTIIAGIVAIVIEENQLTNQYRTLYKCVSAILPNSNWQSQANGQFFESFDSYDPTSAFPCS